MRLFSPTVTFRVSALVVAVFVFFGAVFTEPTRRIFAFIQDFIVLKFGWFYTMAVGFFLVFIIWLFLSPLGKVRLGPVMVSTPSRRPCGDNAAQLAAGHLQLTPPGAPQASGGDKVTLSFCWQMSGPLPALPASRRSSLVSCSTTRST